MKPLRNPFVSKSLSAAQAGSIWNGVNAGRFGWMLSLSAITLLGSHSAQATSAFWDGTGTDWAVGASWSTTSGATAPNVTNANVPGSSDTATFNATTGFTTVTTTSVTINTILFDGASVLAYTLGTAVGTGQITLNDSGAITINSAVVNNQVINANVVLGLTRGAANYTFTNNSTTSLLTVAGSVSGGTTGGTAGNKVIIIAGSGNTLISGLIANGNATSVGLTKTGLGVITLSNASSTYSGPTTISAGTLRVGAAAPSGANGALGNATSAVILGDGSTSASGAPSLLINGAFTVARAISVGSVANTAAYSATIGGSNTTGTSTFSGGITLNNTATNYTTTLQAATGGTVDFITGTWTTNNRAIAIGSSGNTGTVKLSNILATSGGISVNFGTLLLGASDRLDNATPVTVAGGIFDTGIALTDTVGQFNMSSGSLNGTGTITAGTYGLSGGTVTGNLGAGTLNSSGTVALNGIAGALAVNVTAGTLTLGSANRLADGATVAVSGGTLAMGANTDTVSIFNMSSGAITGTGPLTATTYGLSGGTVTGNLGTGTLNSSGTVALNGTAGALAVNVTAGTLSLGSANRLADGATVAVSGGTLAMGANTDTVTIFNMSSGDITGTGPLTATTYGLSGGTVTGNLGAGTLNSSGTVALNGTAGALAVNVTAGTLTLGSANRLADGATVAVSGGTLAMGANTDTVSIFNMSSGAITGTGPLTATTYGLSGGTVTGNLGTGTLNSSGTVALNGIAGALAVNVTAGTLTLGSADRLADGATVGVSGGTLALGGNTDTVSIFNMSSGAITGTGPLTATTYGLSGGTVTGNLGAGTMNVTTSAVNLNGTSGATAVNVNSGTLLLGSNDRLADGATVLIAGGTLDTGTALTDLVSSFSMSSGFLNGTGTITAATYSLSGGTVNAKLGSGTLSVSGTVALNGTSAASAINVSSGSLMLGSSNLLTDNAAAVTVSGGALAMGNFSDTVGAVSLTGGGITGTGGTLTGSSYAVQSGSISALLGGSGITLTKATLGTVSLSGANTYTGATTIKAGTLELLAGGSLASSSIIVGDTGSTGAILDAITNGLVVASGQTVSGIGTIKGSTTIQLGGVIAPGNSPGILSNVGNMTLASGSNFQAEINGLGAGTAYDQLDVTGVVTLAGLLNVATNFTPAQGGLFFLINNDALDAISGTFSNAAINGDTYAFGLQQYAVSYFGDYGTASFTGGNDLVLMAVPEPGAALIGGLGVLCLLRRRRRPTV